MLKKTFIIAVLVLMTGLIVMSASSSAQTNQPVSKFTPKTVELQLTLRDLWLGHVFWVRNVVIATVSKDQRAANLAEVKVSMNAREIAHSVVPYFSNETANRFYALLWSQYGAVKNYMTAAFAYDMAGRRAAAAAVDKNATETAAFLNSINSYWPKAELTYQFDTLGALHIFEIDEINDGNYFADANTWDGMVSHSHKIADIMARGIVKKFPDRF